MIKGETMKVFEVSVLGVIIKAELLHLRELRNKNDVYYDLKWGIENSFRDFMREKYEI